MFKICTTAVLIFLSVTAFSQRDFFIFKRKSSNIEIYTEGKYIHCELVSRIWIEGYITAIRSDSVSISLFTINYAPTIWGTLLPDTIHNGMISLPVAEIYAFPAIRDGKTPGVPSALLISKALQYGGAGYDALNLINSLATREPPFAAGNLGRLAGGAAFFLAGKILQRIFGSPVKIIGKKYHLQYISMSGSSQ